MSIEVTTVLVLGFAWAVAATTSSARPRLGLGRSLIALCWTLAAIAFAGAVVAAATSTTWPATWLVWLLSSIAVAIATRAPSRATSEGSGVVTILVVATISAVAVLAALLLVAEVIGWPARIGVIANIELIALGALTVVAQLTITRQWSPTLLSLCAGAGVIAVSASLALLMVHLLFGDITTDALTAGEAFAAASIATASAVLVLPLTIGAVQRRTERHRPDGKRVLARLDRLFERRAPLDETLLLSVELLRSSLDLRGAEVWTLSGSRLQLAAADPYAPGREIEIGDTAQRVAAAAGHQGPGNWMRTWIPELFADGEEPVVGAVSYAGALQGIVLARTAEVTGEIVPGLIHDVAHRLGPVMHSASLDASLARSLVDLQERERELRASRERLVTAADNERWRIERDLHDGAQQQLVALGVNLQLVRGLVSSNPERARALIDELIEAARATTEQLRALSHGIYPQVLEDEGIGPALDETAKRHNDLPIQVTSSGVERLPREIEAAVYFSCSEAITNAVKHARPTKIVVSLVVHSGQLLFEVADDGIGFEPDHGGAQRNGLDNMADRLGAVGGTLTISSGGDGTRIVGVVPISDQAER